MRRRHFAVGNYFAIAAMLLMTTGATAQQWPNIPPEALRPPSVLHPFSFEGVLGYWYSSGMINFEFSNTDPLFGDPTSTIDWKDMTAHIGEVFARIDHRPTNLFV